jgi:predicted amidohydrolase
MSTLRIAVAQINCVVGDLDCNVRLILDAARSALGQGADLLLTPELALCSYPPEDLLLRPDFLLACARSLAGLALEADHAAPGLSLLVGHPHVSGERCFNAASLIRAGRVEATYFKMRLPNYEVFDEERYFDEGSEPLVFEVAGVRVGVNICADVWEPGAPEMPRPPPARRSWPCSMHRPGTWTNRLRANRCWPIASWPPAFRRSTAIWSADRMNWCSTGHPLRSTAGVVSRGARRTAAKPCR